MSSELTTAYVLEKMRLERITTACKADLEKVMQQCAMFGEYKAAVRSVKLQIERQQISYEKRRNEQIAQLIGNEKRIIEKHAVLVKQEIQNMLQQIRIELHELERLSYSLEYENDYCDTLERNIDNGTDADNLLESATAFLSKIQAKKTEVLKNHAASDRTEDYARVSDTAKSGFFVSLQLDDNKPLLNDGVDPQIEFEHQIMLYKERIPEKELELEDMLEGLRSSPAGLKNYYVKKNQPVLNEYIKEHEAALEQQKDLDGSRQVLLTKYLALCQLLHIIPDDKYSEDMSAYVMQELETDCIALEERQRKNAENAYVEDSIREIFERHGIMYISDDAEADRDERQMVFGIDTHSNLLISRSGKDSVTIKFNAIADSPEASTDELLSAVESAKTTCSVTKTVLEELKREKGIAFRTYYIEEPDTKSISVVSRTDHSYYHNKQLEQYMK